MILENNVGNFETGKNDFFKSPFCRPFLILKMIRKTASKEYNYFTLKCLGLGKIIED